jgi:CRISPR-associated protein Csd1
MFLQRLSEYADQIAEMPPLMYQPADVRYLISLDAEGRPQGEMLDRATKEQKRGPEVLIPDLTRTVGVDPRLLVDNAEYVLGLPRESSKPARVQKQHALFVELVQQCAAQTNDWRVNAIARFLTNPDYRQMLKLPEPFDPTQNIMFEVEGSNPITDPTVQAFWVEKTAVGDADHPVQCLVCGQVRSPVARLPISISGIYGGQSSGMALISANSKAFESYGLEASLIAPTCVDCGYRFGNALNTLLSQEATHITIPPVVYIFWARETLPFSPGTLLKQAQPGQVHAFFEATWRSKPEAVKLDTSPFYAAALTASGARVVLRSWLEMTLGQAQQHLERYFTLQRLRDVKGELRYQPLGQLARATINPKSTKEEPAGQIVTALLRMALEGVALPNGVLYQVVRRVRAEGRVTTSQAALIKMVLASSETEERMNRMVELDKTEQREAYFCGRMLAIIEEIQYKALGDVNSSVTDRHFATASSAPAYVFPRLIRGAKYHLSKLRRDDATKGAAIALERQLGDVLDRFLSVDASQSKSAFPTTLTLPDQGWFALGYYHQQVAIRREQQERKAVAEKKREASSTIGKEADAASAS